MSIDAHIIGAGDKRQTRVTRGGALAVAPVLTSKAFNATLGIDDTVVNIVPAVSNHVFIITGIFLTSNKNVDQTTAATVAIYTADSETTSKGNALTTLIESPVRRSSTRDYNPVNIEAEEGKWINGETTDDDVLVTILGYYLRNE